MKPLVSVITPTWLRHDWLLHRCMPSVQGQTYPHIEHIIVSDGPDPELAVLMKDLQRLAPVLAPKIIFEELPDHEPTQHWGNRCRLRALELASGSLIAYIDDDDRLYPRHVDLLARPLLERPELMWVYSQMYSHGAAAVGDYVVAGPPANGSIGTPMLMHRPELLEVATWGSATGDSSTEDWELVSAWMQSGAPYDKVSEVTCEVWPSAHR